MQEIAFEIDAQRVGRASGYLGGLTVERYTFTGATIPAGTRLAILTRAGVTIAAAEIAEGNAATVDTNTQEVADLLRYQPLGACESVYIALGNADTIIALIPAVMRKNWLDDEATHPPVPANRYPTKAELDEWLARFDERAASTAAAKSAAQAAASSASGSATEAKAAASTAQKAATDAADSAKDAGDSAVHAQDAQAAAEAAQSKAETAQRAAETAAAAAGESAGVAAVSERAAISAKQSAETAQAQAQASEQAAKASENAAKGAETAARASEQAAKASEKAAEAAKTGAETAKTGADAAKTAAATSATAAEAAKTAAETAKTGAEAAQTAAASSATAAANSAAAAAKSATDLAEAVATAESLDGRISTIEGLGTQYKRDFRVDTTGLVNPLATSLATSSPFASIYRRTNKGYDGRYFSDCQHHILNDYDSAFIYGQNGKYLGRITNTGVGSTVAHPGWQFACLTTQIGDYRYGIFNGFPYDRNKMIISKFKRNADNTDYELVASRVYATRGVDGAIFQWGGGHHYVGPVVPSRRTGHILVFGDYYMSVKNDEGAIVDQSIGYGYIVFDSDLNFVKWDETAGAFVSSETFDMSYFHAVSGRAGNGITAYWAWQNAQHLSLVAVQQATNATNGLYYVDPHDNLVPITFSGGPYANAGVDYLPLGGSLLSVDSTALFSTYAPLLVMSGVESDDESGKAMGVKIFNGARMFYITMTLTDEEPGCTFTYRRNYSISQTQFNGSRISDNNYLFLHGLFTDTYTETQLFLYRNGYIYSSDGKYVRSLTLPLNLAHISPQRGTYARGYHLQFAPCGGYTSPTGAVLLDM